MIIHENTSFSSDYHTVTKIREHQPLTIFFVSLLQQNFRNFYYLSSKSHIKIFLNIRFNLQVLHRLYPICTQCKGNYLVTADMIIFASKMRLINNKKATFCFCVYQQQTYKMLKSEQRLKREYLISKLQTHYYIQKEHQ